MRFGCCFATIGAFTGMSVTWMTDSPTRAQCYTTNSYPACNEYPLPFPTYSCGPGNTVSCGPYPSQNDECGVASPASSGSAASRSFEAMCTWTERVCSGMNPASCETGGTSSSVRQCAHADGSSCPQGNGGGPPGTQFAEE